MKKIIFPILTFIFAYNIGFSQNKKTTILVWEGYYQFIPDLSTNPDLNSILIGDTIQWRPLEHPQNMTHTITSTSIPNGATPFDYLWDYSNGDTLFSYIPQVLGTYYYECTPHISFGMTAQFTVVSPSGIKQNIKREKGFTITKNYIQPRNSNYSNIAIYDLIGNKMTVKTENSLIMINNLPKGMYFIKYIHNNQPYTQKFFR